MSNSKPLISVIIPAYNAEKTIQTTIRSVLSQDYSNIELIVIDDGSTDRTVARVWEMRGECNEQGIKLNLIAQQNTGVSQARNRGVAKAKGELLAFLDADDEWLPGKISAHVEHLNQLPALGLSFARVNFMTVDGAKRKSSKIPAQDVQAGDFLSTNATISPSNWVLRKQAFQAIEGFKTTMTHAEDQDFLIRLIAQTDFSVQGLDRVLVNYMTSHDGLSANIDAMYAGWQQLIQTLKQESMSGYEPCEYDQHHRQYCLFLTRRAMQTQQPVQSAWRYFARAIFAAPASLLSKPVEPSTLALGLIGYSLKSVVKTVTHRTPNATHNTVHAKNQEASNA